MIHLKTKSNQNYSFHSLAQPKLVDMLVHVSKSALDRFDYSFLILFFNSSQHYVFYLKNAIKNIFSSYS